MNEELSALRERAKEGRDPTAADETLRFLLHWAKEHGVKKYLEIGAAEGLTATALLLETAASVTAIEKDAARRGRGRILPVSAQWIARSCSRGMRGKSCPCSAADMI